MPAESVRLPLRKSRQRRPPRPAVVAEQRAETAWALAALRDDAHPLWRGAVACSFTVAEDVRRCPSCKHCATSARRTAGDALRRPRATFPPLPARYETRLRFVPEYCSCEIPHRDRSRCVPPDERSSTMSTLDGEAHAAQSAQRAVAGGADRRRGLNRAPLLRLPGPAGSPLSGTCASAALAYHCSAGEAGH
jgi:hypothetical protein